MDAATILALAQQADAARRITNDSVWGAVALLVATAMGTAIVVLWRTHSQTQAQRVADAQAVTAQLLRINESCVTALTNNSTTLEAIQQSMGELKQAFRDLESEVRQRPRRPGG